MTVVLQLSDLHLLGGHDAERAILDALPAAVQSERAWRDAPVDVLAVTGDVFDSASVDPQRATGEFIQLLGRLRDAVGAPFLTVVVPGNHDRRGLGLFGPHRQLLFDELHAAVDDNVFVHGCDVPFLADVVPPERHGQPLWVVAYDSTYLPRGLLSAGGIVRQEDLLHAAAVIGDRHPDWPVLFLLHHHLVPTPLTDLGTIEAAQVPALVRFGIRRLLPHLVAHADREELTMTALGAGTALSTLHSLGRPVVVLHGHKHYATARLLAGIREGQGDVLLVSAGSAGTAQSWTHGSGRGTARLWPSFNWLELERDALAVDVVSFGYKGRSTAKPSRHPLVRARRRGWRWEALALPEDSFEDRRRRLLTNHSRVQLEPSRLQAGQRWDLACLRQVAVAPRVNLLRYVETIDGPEGARLTHASRVTRTLPTQLELRLDGDTEYRLDGAIPKSLAEATRLFGHRMSPYGSAGLMNRYASDSTRLEVSGLGHRGEAAFASATDLGTGLERPMHLARSLDRVVLDSPNCPPRTLLRVYWRLDVDP